MFWIKKSYFLVIGAPKYAISTLCIIFYAYISRTGKKVRHFKASFATTVISKSKWKKYDFSHFSNLNKKDTSDFVYFVFFFIIKIHGNHQELGVCGGMVFIGQPLCPISL